MVDNTFPPPAGGVAARTAPMAPGQSPASGIGPIGHGRRRITRHGRVAIVMLAFAIAAAAVMLTSLLYFGFQSALRDAGKETRNLASLIELKLDATLERTDAVIGELIESVPQAGLKPDAVRVYKADIERLLDQHAESFPEVTGLRVADANGEILYETKDARGRGANIADRDYFIQLRDNPKSGLVMSGVLVSRITGRQTIAVGRAIRAKDGAFLGTAYALLDIESFRDLIRNLDIGPHGLVAIRRSDNFKLVMRWPALDEFLNRPDPPGSPTRSSIESGKTSDTLMIESLTDGIARLFSLQALQKYPLYIIVAKAKPDILAPWYQRAWAVGGVGLLIMIALATLYARLQRAEMHEAETEQELIANEQRLRLMATLFEHGAEPGFICDNERHIVATNDSFSRVTGFSVDDAMGMHPGILLRDIVTHDEQFAIDNALDTIGYWQGELRGHRKDGSFFPRDQTISAVRDDDGAITHLVATFSDITERKAAEDRIYQLAYQDPLTGLANRLSMHGRLEQALNSAHRDGTKVAVALLDMDRFKTINDTLGHPVGDRMLIEVGRRLSANVRESDIAARLGGDEFIVVFTQIPSADTAARQVEKILRDLGRAYIFDGLELHSTPSIGISLYPDDGHSVESLISNADAAMYQAKSFGRNNYQFFTEAMNEAANERMELENDLRHAIERKELFLHFQPQINSLSGRAVGVEALARWKHPTRGLIPPTKFIHVAEETGLIVELGDWVLRESLRQLRAWRKAGHPVDRMSVNLSAHQLRVRGFAKTVAAMLDEFDLTGNDLELEITETVAMQNPESTIAVLTALRGMGIGLAIDDFGTGYSSLSHLKLLPIHRLKLDQSFVQNVATDANDAAICAASIALAHKLGLTVVAEGVETETQFDLISALGGDVIQGYYFSRPVLAGPAGDFFHHADTESVE